ncbi:hypothetical protein T439DRAFT_377692 [Meredithblackwellia eburnea MCA 4105]
MKFTLATVLALGVCGATASPVAKRAAAPWLHDLSIVIDASSISNPACSSEQTQMNAAVASCESGQLIYGNCICSSSVLGVLTSAASCYDKVQSSYSASSAVLDLINVQCPSLLAQASSSAAVAPASSPAAAASPVTTTTNAGGAQATTTVAQAASTTGSSKSSDASQLVKSTALGIVALAAVFFVSF